MKQNEPEQNRQDESKHEDKEEAVQGGTSRRKFLQVTGVGTAAAALATFCQDETNDPGDTGGSDIDTDSDVDSDSDTDLDADSDSDTDMDSDTDSDTDTEETPFNRVVRVVDSKATTWSGGDFDDFYQYGVQSVVDDMFEKGLKVLTGQGSLTNAWKSLIPNYNSGELVAVHINGYANNDNDRKNNISHPMSAIVHGLVDLLNIPASRVAIVDPSQRGLVNGASSVRLVDNCRHSNELSWGLYENQMASEIVSTEGNEFSSPVRLARVIEEADHVIMVPVFSWHGGNWITGAMKMMVGSMSNMGRIHEGVNGGMRENAFLADVCKMFASKVRLVVGEGLFGNTVSNSAAPHAFVTLGGDGREHPSSTMYFSRDMVALDCVMYDDLLDEAQAAGNPKRGYRYGFLEYAADENHNLGTYEMRDETGNSSYQKIDLVEV